MPGYALINPPGPQVGLDLSIIGQPTRPEVDQDQALKGPSMFLPLGNTVGWHQ
jgi:hypothetical protein